MASVWNWICSLFQGEGNRNAFVREFDQYVASIDQCTGKALEALEDQKREIDGLKCNTGATDSIYQVEKCQVTITEQVKQLQTINDGLKKFLHSIYNRSSGEERNKKVERKPKSKVYVQVFMPSKEERITNLWRELRAMLESRFDQENMLLNSNTVENFGDVNPNQPLLIFCINVSRLGSDVDLALQGLNLSENQVLVVIHHQPIHALPKQPSERKLTSSSSTVKLGGIYDIGFLPREGIYKCDMNEKTISNLVKFIIKCQHKSGH